MLLRSPTTGLAPLLAPCIGARALSLKHLRRRPPAPPPPPRATPSTLLVEDRDRIRWITLNRPASLNALTLQDLEAFRDAVNDAPDTVRAIAVLGAGRAFCAGMNTSTFEGLDAAGARNVITKVSHAVGSLRLSPKPTAVVMHGYCLGAAFEMALAADFRIATRDAKVGLPETKVGIPSVVDAALLQHYVGLSRAKEMILAGDVWAVQDLGAGFVNRYADDQAGLQQAAGEILGKVTGLTPVVMKAQKELHETWLNVPLKQGIERSIDVFAEVFAHPDTQEAVHKYNKK